MTLAEFRAAYPEFNDTAKYPDAVVSRYLTLATSLLNPCAWGDQLDLGIGLFAAHYLVTYARAMAAAAAGVGSGVGAVNGPINSKSVDKVSVAYDIGAVAIEDGGFWNSTSYGIQYLTFARMFGAWAIQL